MIISDHIIVQSIKAIVALPLFASPIRYHIEILRLSKAHHPAIPQ